MFLMEAGTLGLALTSFLMKTRPLSGGAGSNVKDARHPE